jgi:hypothetical protein
MSFVKLAVAVKEAKDVSFKSVKVKDVKVRVFWILEKLDCKARLNFIAIFFIIFLKLHRLLFNFSNFDCEKFLECVVKTFDLL